MLATRSRLQRWVQRLLTPQPVPAADPPPTPETPGVDASDAAPAPEPISTTPKCRAGPRSSTEAQADQVAWAADRRHWDSIAHQLQHFPAGEHARRLLAYVQTPRSQVLTYLDVQEAYYSMCVERWIDPLSWRAVAKHFVPMTGGKKYRSAVHPKTGRREARERIYRIPAYGAELAPCPGARRPGRKAAPAQAARGESRGAAAVSANRRAA